MLNRFPRFIGLLACLGIALYALAAFSPSNAAAAVDSTSSPSPSRTVLLDQDTGPSKAAQMTCGQDLQYVIQLTLHLGDLPKPTSDWTNMRFTCRYDLEAGPLILTVKELPDVDTAKQYFIGLQRNMGSSQDVSGITSLGLPGYQSPTGQVIFLKDNMTLSVDASRLNDPLGEDTLSRGDLALRIATNVLACWTGDD